MGNDPSKTVRDDAAARERVQATWVQSTVDDYIKACRTWQSSPEDSLARLRKVLEGWAYATSLALDEGFKPYDGSDLHRPPLSDRLQKIRHHLPPTLRTWVDYAKKLSDGAHHVRAASEPIDPRLVRSALAECALLIEWMYSTLAKPGALHTAPPEFHAARRDLQETTINHPQPTVVLRPFFVDTPNPVTVVTPIPDRPPAPYVAPTQEMIQPARTPLPAAKRKGDARSSNGAMVALFVAGVVASVVLALLIFGEGSTRPSAALPLPGSSRVSQPLSPASAPPRSSAPDAQTALGFVDTYAKALTSRDLDAIMRLHVFPARHFITWTNAAPEKVRAADEEQFKKEPLGTIYEFKSCVAQPPAFDGSVAVRCGSPVSPSNRMVGACLVFTADGRLISRTELARTPECPPR